MPVMKIKAILLPFGEVGGCIRSATLDQGGAVPFEGPSRRLYLAHLVHARFLSSISNYTKRKERKLQNFIE